MTDSAEDSRTILRDFRRIAVVGLSNKPDRTVYRVSEYLQANGYDITPVHPRAEPVLGRAGCASLGEVAPAAEVVAVFLAAEKVGPVVDEAIRAGARAVWMPDGVEDPVAADRARSAGLRVVMNRCMMRDHRAGNA